MSVRKIRVVVLLFLSGWIVVACLPEPLEVDGLPVVKPQMVVSSQIIPDQSLVVLLTKTFGALDASDDSDPAELLQQIAVTDAIVTLTGPLGIDTLIALDNGIYGGVLLEFKEGDVYTLDAVSESMGRITATTSVQAAVTFDQIEADLYYNGFDDTLAQISYSLQDPGTRNFYMVNVQEVENEDLIENVLNPRSFTRLVEDTDFNGEHYSETFRVVPRDYHEGDTIAVSLSNVSEEYYRFLKLRQDNRFNFLQYLGEPVNYPTNVKGGKGYFNLYMPDFRVFQLE